MDDSVRKRTTSGTRDHFYIRHNASSPQVTAELMAPYLAVERTSMRSGRITLVLSGKPNVNCRYQAIAQACAVYSPLCGTMSEMERFLNSYLRRRLES